MMDDSIIIDVKWNGIHEKIIFTRDTLQGIALASGNVQRDLMYRIDERLQDIIEDLYDNLEEKMLNGKE